MHQFPDEELRKALDRLAGQMLEIQRQLRDSLARTIGPMLEAQKAMADSMAQITRPLMEFQRHFAEMNERIAVQLQKVAETMKAALEREARNRGITVPELLEAIQSSAEVIEDPEELKKFQAVVAYNLYQNREISLVRFIRALPVEYRPAPAERTGIADEDFEPLVSGITRKN